MIDFLGIGAQKAGTTWLYRMLESHPSIRFPAGKEGHFWNRPGGCATDEYLGVFGDQPAGVRSGEITPAYALLETDAIRRIASINPALRILFVLRNPIERAWSSALMALHRAELRFEEASDQWFIDHFRSAGSIGRGDYETTLRRWYEAFPSSQLLLLRFEDIRDAPRALLQQCATHLDIDPAHYSVLPESALAQRIFPGPGFALRPDLHAELLAIYRQRIAGFARYAALDLSHWS